jgi:type IV secretory pathway TraG/TraD family ATPase VirD4
MPAPVRPTSPAGDIATAWPWIGVGAAAVLAVLDTAVWLAARLASLLTGRGWTGPTWSLGLVVRAGRDGMDAVAPAAPAAVAWMIVAGLVLVGLAALAVPTSWGMRRWFGPRDPARSMATRREVRDLTGVRAATRAVRLRPSLSETRPEQLADRDRGIHLGRLKRGRDQLYASWEDVLLAVMGPRSGKTTALTTPIVLNGPGWVVATSNKADLWTTTIAARQAHGMVWTFDPQAIVHAEQRMWWDPISSVRDVATAHRLASHFVAEVRGERGDKDFWIAAALDLLTSLLLAAARSGQGISAVDDWLNDTTNPEPVNLLTAAGDVSAANSLRGRQRGASDTREGIYETARTAVQCLRDHQIMRWVTTPDDPDVRHFDIAAFVRSTDTLYLLSKDGAGSSAPLVAGFTDAVMRAAVETAERAGGRLDPPGLVVLDEAANICRIGDLPDLYSHLGSRGVIPITILQSIKQGIRVWGEHGMGALWSAATIKLVGAGLDDPRDADDVSRLIGEEDVDTLSTTSEPGRYSRQLATRRQRILEAADVRALPKGTAVLLATGIRAALVQLQPWYTGPHAAAIAADQTRAEDGVTRRAYTALTGQPSQTGADR